jgi:hypothetical protein
MSGEEREEAFVGRVKDVEAPPRQEGRALLVTIESPHEKEGDSPTTRILWLWVKDQQGRDEREELKQEVYKALADDRPRKWTMLRTGKFNRGVEYRHLIGGGEVVAS